MERRHLAGPGQVPARLQHGTDFTFGAQPAAHTGSMPHKPTNKVARERRAQQAIEDAAKLRDGLTAPQLATLRSMEEFQWTLRFVRRPMFQAPVPVLFSRDGKRMAVLEADGSINENPGFKIRP